MTILQMSLMGTVLIALMVILRRLAGSRLSPGCYLWLWLAIGLRMLIPIELCSPFSVYNIFSDFSATHNTDILVPVAINTVGQIMDIARIPVEEARSVPWVTLLWLTGAVGVFMTIFLRHRRELHIYSTSLPVTDAFVLAWQKEHTLYRRYQIRQSQQIDTPITYGVICPVILLPADRNMDDAAMELMLLHEWHHIRHWDVLWQWMLVLLCSLYWFHPCVWLMNALCRQDMELFCDCATVRCIDSDRRKSYAMLLLSQSCRSADTPLFSQFCYTGYHRMEERVKNIMIQKPAGWKRILATVVLLLTGGGCFAASASDVNHADKWIDVKMPGTHGESVTTLVWPVASEDSVFTMLNGVRVHPVTGQEMKIDHVCIGGVEQGTDIIAAASGVVKEAGFDAKRGNYLIVQCEDNLETHYWHCERLLVEEGERVAVYDKIATMGKTGDATGPCLSFAVYQDGEVCVLMQKLK